MYKFVFMLLCYQAERESLMAIYLESLHLLENAMLTCWVVLLNGEDKIPLQQKKNIN